MKLILRMSSFGDGPSHSSQRAHTNAVPNGKPALGAIDLTDAVPRGKLASEDRFTHHAICTWKARCLHRHRTTMPTGRGRQACPFSGASPGSALRPLQSALPLQP